LGVLRLTPIPQWQTIGAWSLILTRAKMPSTVPSMALSLADAARLDWESARLYPDLRRDYGEARMIALVPMGQRVHSVVFVDSAQGAF